METPPIRRAGLRHKPPRPSPPPTRRSDHCIPARALPGWPRSATPTSSTPPRSRKMPSRPGKRSAFEPSQRHPATPPPLRRGLPQPDPGTILTAASGAEHRQTLAHSVSCGFTSMRTPAPAGATESPSHWSPSILLSCPSCASWFNLEQPVGSQITQIITSLDRTYHAPAR